LKVKLSRRAELAVLRIDGRWRESANHPDVFLLEMQEAVEFLETVRTPGTPFPTGKHPALRRILLEKSKCHLYFEINQRQGRVDVLTVWDGRRERPPKL
jgi:hypothetical protein